MKRLIALVAFSIACSLLGLFLVGREALLDPAAYRPHDTSLPLVLGAVLAFAALWLLPSIKMYLLALTQGFRLSALQAQATHVATVFGSAMTPSGSGGGPALVLALQRLGVPIGAGLGVAVQLFVLDLTTFAWLIPLALAYLVLDSSVQVSLGLELGGAAAAVLAAAAAVVLTRFPRLVVAVLVWLSNRRLLKRFRKRLIAISRDYYTSARAFTSMNGWQRVVLQLVTVVSYLANFLLLWLLLDMYGVATHPLDVSALLSILTLIGFLVPTPGASGYTELAVGLAVTGRFDAGAVAAPILVWRLVTFYLVFLLGPMTGWWLVFTERSRLREPERSADGSRR